MIAMISGVRMHVEFKSRFDGQSDYMVFCNGKETRVRWKDGHPPTAPFSKEIGVSEADAILAVRTFCEEEYQKYLDWHKTHAQEIEVQPQTKGLTVG